MVFIDYDEDYWGSKCALLLKELPVAPPPDFFRRDLHMPSKPILYLDFDGVLHSYTSGWKGVDIIPDPPVPGAMQFLVGATEAFQVSIFASRSKDRAGVQAMRKWLRYCLEEEGFSEEVELEIDFSAEKPPAMLTIDDRALTFTGRWPSIEELKAFKPWYQREAQPAEANRVRDLALLVRRMAGQLQKGVSSPNLAGAALDYLKRHRLLGVVLRDEPEPAQETTHDVLSEVASERLRQVLGEGYSEAYDDAHTGGVRQLNDALCSVLNVKPIHDILIEVAGERRRQIIEKGHSATKDDRYTNRELVEAAVWLLDARFELCLEGTIWPWPKTTPKQPHTPRQSLIQACALLVAEIERLDRLDVRTTEQRG